jgi:hypothetical protein
VRCGFLNERERIDTEISEKDQTGLEKMRISRYYILFVHYFEI